MDLKQYLNGLEVAFKTNLSLAMSKEGSILSEEDAKSAFETIKKDVTKIAEKDGIREELLEVQPIRFEDGTLFFFVQDGIKRIKISVSLVSGDKRPHYRVKRIKHGSTR